MTTTPVHLHRSATVTAATGYVALFVLAIFANFVVRLGLIDPDNVEGTITMIREHEGLFRLGLVSFAAIFLIDIAVAWALFVVLQPAGALTSVNAAWFRLAYSVMLAVGTVFLYLGMTIAIGNSTLGAELAMLMFQGFEVSWSLGLLAFGLHLILIGVLIARTRVGPRLLGIALTVAGSAYVTDGVLQIALVDYAAVADVMMAIVAIPSVIAELSFTVWLIVLVIRNRSLSAEARIQPIADAGVKE
jgi:hypothetical protein